MIEFTHLLVVQKLKDAEMVLRKEGKMCAITSDTPGRDNLKCNLSVSVPMQWQFFDFNLLFSKSPKPF